VPTGTDVLEDQKSVPLYTEIRAWNFDNVWSFLRHQSLFDYANVNMKSTLTLTISLCHRPSTLLNSADHYS